MLSLLLLCLPACTPDGDVVSNPIDRGDDEAGDADTGIADDTDAADTDDALEDGEDRGGGDDGDATWISLLADDPCESPCTFRAEGSADIAAVTYDADGWDLGTSTSVDFSLIYDFYTLGDRAITATGLDSAGLAIAADGRTITVEGAACSSYDSTEQEYAPVQTVGSGLPSGAYDLTWETPTTYTWYAPFSGTPGYSASHEGIDYVHDNSSVSRVEVVAAAAGEVVYVREGCPQSATFSSNGSSRECGSGWGNHVIVHHGGEIYTRYAHLEDETIVVDVGDDVSRGDLLAEMGNSGRSDVRHLHFELGSDSDGLDPCAPAQSFDRVYDPAQLGI